MEHLNYARFDRDTNEKKYDSMFASQLPMRPSYNTAGKEIQIRVNQFKVLKYPQKDIFQYDVSFYFQILISFDLFEADYTGSHRLWG